MPAFRGLSICLAIIVFFLIAGLSARSLAQGSIGEFRTGEVLVEIRPGASIDAINQRYGTSTIQRIYGTNLYRLRTKEGKESRVRKKLGLDSDVLSAALNPVITTPVNAFGHAVIGFPGDHPESGQARSSYLSQRLVGDLGAIQLRARGAGVIVAVIDTGIDRLHADIKDHIWTDPGEIPDDNIDNDNDGLIDDVYGWSFLDASKDTLERRDTATSSVSGHGTFIAGLIALIAPDAKIMPIRAFSSDGVSDAFSIAQSIKYAVDHGAQVVNLSFGTTEDSQVIHDAVSYAEQRGVLLVAAAGNEAISDDLAPQFPANWKSQVMSVAAIDSNDRKAGFSNYGSNISVSAPGVDIVSLYPGANNNSDYATWSGTSFAAPLAAAEGALILETDPRHSARASIENNAVDIDSLNPGLAGKLGKGRIDPLRALQSLDVASSNHKEIVLMPSGPEPGARGKADVSISGADQEFEIEVERLQPRAAYKVVVDGRVIVDGTSGDALATRAVTSNFGAFRIRFSTTPNGTDSPLPGVLNPVTTIKLVEVRNAQDRVVLANAFGVPQNNGGGEIEKEAVLTSTGQAKGKARVEFRAEREKLRIEGEHLQSGVAYEIFADGVSLGSALAQSGYFRVEFTSDNTSGSLIPAALRPVIRIQHIEVRDAANRIVLQGNFQAGGEDFGGGGGSSGSGSGSGSSGSGSSGSGSSGSGSSGSGSSGSGSSGSGSGSGSSGSGSGSGSSGSGSSGSGSSGSGSSGSGK